MTMLDDKIAFVNDSIAARRLVAASAGLVAVKQLFDAARDNEQTWAAFIAEHFPFDVERANALIGRMAFRGGLLCCQNCAAKLATVCECGVPYLPGGPITIEPKPKPEPATALQRAAEAIAAEPGMSDRAIAKKIGVAPNTVKAARRSGAQSGAQSVRLGRDGKRYRPARLKSQSHQRSKKRKTR